MGNRLPHGLGGCNHWVAMLGMMTRGSQRNGITLQFIRLHQFCRSSRWFAQECLLPKISTKNQTNFPSRPYT
jgi:hypothetical protein